MPFGSGTGRASDPFILREVGRKPSLIEAAGRAVFRILRFFQFVRWCWPLMRCFGPKGTKGRIKRDHLKLVIRDDSGTQVFLAKRLDFAWQPHSSSYIHRIYVVENIR
jgi:hypothetical protein